ncbi:winged helix-turn-helix domain-containing protein [Streptomyces netropsis]|uniref:DNA-binding transcriptional ArsR family regulator n=1 Tax=Streptomyces netropsis TaxID=55404 RepID=A0A7W7PD01_STRNE|nr:winged helix-turn-helix domain-containing protein [Streptomyces netropsis]MBB4885092.1 DNA-binding transcriptional ArsR family regulator [Streptomyces netropsis]GGR26709.1 transcriptional regulator [Streptomyces netropsis]
MTKETEGTPATKPTRRIDARSLRGLAHPLRMAILEALSLDGPATATLLSRRLGESTGTVSWHLRHLAEHGYIEEETGRGTKRERWWRAVNDAKLLNPAEFRDDPDTRDALAVYLHQLAQQFFSRTVTFLGEDWDGAWQQAATFSDWRDLRLTPAQLARLNQDLMAVVARHTPAPGEEPASDALPVIVQIQSFPRQEPDGA